MSSNIDWLAQENRIRATPLNLLKQGIEQQQWEAITLAYFILSGELIKAGGTTAGIVAVAPPQPLPAEPELEPEEEEDEDEEQDEPLEDEEVEDEEPQEDEGDEEEDDEDTIDLEDLDDEDEKPKKRKKKNSGGSNHIETRTVKVSAKGRKNQFVDDLTEAIEDNAFLPKKEIPATVRGLKRPPHKRVAVQCSKCGKKEKIDPTLAPRKLDRNYRMLYRCNDCSCGPGG